MEEQGSFDSDDPEYRKVFAALDELDLSSIKPLFKEKHFRDKTLSFIKSEEELKLILKEELTLPFGQRFEFSRLWFEKYHGNEVTTTGQTKKKIKSDNDVQVPKEGGKQSSAPLKEAVVVDDQDEKQKIDGRISTQDRPKMVDTTREKPNIGSDVKVKKCQEKVNEMSKTQTAEEDPTGRQSVETNELNQTKTLSSSSTGPKEDQIHDNMEDNKITGKSTSTDVLSRDIRNQEEEATSSVNNTNHTFVTGDNSSIQEKTAAVVNEPSKISQREWKMAKRPEEEAGDTSSQQPSTQSKSKKETKKKASKGTGSAEMKEEKGGASSLKGTATVVVDNLAISATAAESAAPDFILPLDNTDDTVTHPQIPSNDDKTKDCIDPSVNNSEAKKSTFADVHDRRISSDENGASSDCIPKDDPFLTADSVIDDQKETRTVVDETPKKEEGMEEGANNTSNQQSSTQSKSKKRKKKVASKGTPGSAETINKGGEEIKVEKEGQASVADDHLATAPEVAATSDEVVKTADYVKEIASVSDASKKGSRKEGEAYQGDSGQKVVPLPVTASSKTSTLKNELSELDGERNANQECESEGDYLRDSKGEQNKESEGVRRCTPRPRDVAGRDTSYEKGSVFDAEENRELEFKSLVNAPLCSLPWKIMEKAKKFICACLNADSRGIIYFGVGDSLEKGSKYQHGEILGLDVEHIKDDINKAFQSVLDDHIKSDAGPLQKGGEQNCVSIHYVPVKIQGNRSNLYVIEIEISRDWRFCKDNIYYSKSWTEKRGGDKDILGKKALSDFFKVKDEVDDVAIRTNGASSCVKQLEVDRQVKKPLEAKYKEWRRKTKHGANETSEVELNVEEADAKRFSVLLRERLRELNHKEYGYVLVANKLPAHYRGTAHLSFLQNIPWVAVFDLFDSSSRRDGLHHTCNETSDAPRANVRTLDDFKEVTPDKDSFLTTRGTTWILNNEEMQKGDWIKCSKDCLYRALSAYKQCFLPGRLVCVFLCFNESAVNEMADIMESSFSILGNSASSCVTIISESRHVAEAFIKASKPSLQKELAECSITGIPWILLKEIIREMVGPSKFQEKGATTELPYFTGQLKEVLNKIVHSWNDLEVYCPNPRLVTRAETIEKERDAFYKGAQASQVNLFHNHSIPRSLENDVTAKVERTLKSLSKENVDTNYHVKTVTVSYEPGSGATTLCRRILWSKRKDYRCAVVKAITPLTDYQIEKLQCIGYEEKNINYALPVLILVDNFAESDVRFLTEHIMKRQTKCVILTTLPISRSLTNCKFEIILGKLDVVETSLVKNILINITSDTERRREAEQVLEREKRFIWFGLELFGREYLKIKERLQNHIRSILMAFLGDSRREHQMLLDICCFLNKYSDGCIILPHSVVLDLLYETSSWAKQKCPDVKDVHDVFGGLLLEEQNETNGYYGWRPAHSLVSEVVTSRISVMETAIRSLEKVCKGKAYAIKFLRQQVFRMFLERKRISDPVFLEEQAIDDGAIGTDLESEVFGSYGKRTRYSPVIVDVLEKESNIEGALNVLLTICEQATQTEDKAYAWQQLARFMGYEMRANSMDKQDDLHQRLYNAMTKERPVKLPMPINGINAAHTAVDIAVSLQPSFCNHYTTKGVLYLLQLRDLKPPQLRSLPEAIEICRKALGVYGKALETSRGPNHFSMIGKIQAIISLLEIVKDLPCFQFDKKFMAYLKKEEVPAEIAEVLSEDEQNYVQSLSATTLDLLNELFGNVKLKQTITYDENEIRSLNNAKIRASNLRRKFYEITGFDKRELSISNVEYSMRLSPSTSQELAFYQQKVQDILFIHDETPFSTWSKLSDSEVDFIYQLLKSICLPGHGSHNDMLICSKACLHLKDRPPVEELNKIVSIWVKKFPNSAWAHLFYYMIHFPIPNGSLGPYNASAKASIQKCGSIIQEKVGSVFRKSGAEYFLGRGKGLNAIISGHEFHRLDTKWKTKTEFWRGKEPSERLERVKGQKELGSKGIISYQGIQLHFDNTRYPNESKDDLWFYVGFTVAGPYAYDPVDNDTYASLTHSMSLSTTSERSIPSDKLGNSSSNNGTRGKVRLSRMSSCKSQEAASTREHDLVENKREASWDNPEVFRSRSPRARNRTRDATHGVSNRGTELITVGGRFGPLLDCAIEPTQKEPKQDGPILLPRKTAELKGDNAVENLVEGDRTVNKKDDLKTTVGTRGAEKKRFHLQYESLDGKLHHGAFVLGAKKSEECFIHNSRSDVRATDRCTFAHGWRGDTLQFVCTKCTEENLYSCKEKIQHEKFIWNLGPYRNSRGEVWKDEVEDSGLG